MRIDFWADVVCPWCYIGKRRLEQALEQFPHADEVTVTFRSFELDPGAPREGTETVAEMLGHRYGGGREAGLQMIEQVGQVAAEAGLQLDQSRSLHRSSHDAHRLLHLALAEGGPSAQSDLEERLFAAYFVEGRDIADQAVLAELGSVVGLDAERAAAVLASDELEDAVARDVAQAQAYGATGVPFIVIDDRYGISGAQPTELFLQTLQRAWAERGQPVPA
ncbi:DsbA family oxidoreductase [Pseudactinotalea suaedae]|uniref:DsbA family oxidoreductase n=1 Tax=Pseudactinotalea suaedae TaxID=1524924 RepID=UPI0012E21AE3|nr:DsbA family oxidoreductase [Pseudactinotalea suaedae]